MERNSRQTVKNVGIMHIIEDELLDSYSPVTLVLAAAKEKEEKLNCVPPPFYSFNLNTQFVCCFIVVFTLFVFSVI